MTGSLHECLELCCRVVSSLQGKLSVQLLAKSQFGFMDRVNSIDDLLLLYNNNN